MLAMQLSAGILLLVCIVDNTDKIRMPVVTLYPKSPTELYANWTLVECKTKCPIMQQNIQWKRKRKHYNLEEFLQPNVTEYTINSKTVLKLDDLLLVMSTFRSHY